MTSFLGSKKAQVTLFIIVGLVILTVSAVIINVNKSSVQIASNENFNKIATGSDSDIKTIKQYFNDVAQESSLSVLSDIGANGGIYYNLSDFNYSTLGVILNQNTHLNYSGHDVLYYVLDYADNNPVKNPWNVSAYPCFRGGLPLSCSFPSGKRYMPYYGDYNMISDTGKVEEMAKLAIEKKIKNSIDWKFINQSYFVPANATITTDVTFTNLISNNQDLSYVTVIVTYDFPLIARSNGNTVSAGSYEMKIPLKIYSMIQLAYDIGFSEALNLNYNPKQGDILGNTANFRLVIHDNVNSKGDHIYELIDDNFRYYDAKNFTFRFAVRNRPPVLGYIPYKQSGDEFFFVNSGDEFTLKLNATDPDEDPFWYELKNVVPYLGTDASFAQKLKQNTSFDSDGTMHINTAGVVGEFSLEIAATDGHDFDSQNVTLVINDIPVVDFSMQNGYYWNANLQVNPNSKYNKSAAYTKRNPILSCYDFEDGFNPAGISRFDSYGKLNPKLKMLYMPCLGQSKNQIDTTTIPRDEYVKLNISSHDIYSSNNQGLIYSWYYACGDYSTNPSLWGSANWKEIKDCDISSQQSSSVCFATGFDCPAGQKITILLNASDGISVGSVNHTFDFSECLSCRPCCINDMPHSPKDIAIYSYAHSTERDDADYVVSAFQGMGGTYYGVLPSTFNTLYDVFYSTGSENFNTLMNSLEYNDSVGNKINNYIPSNMIYYDINYNQISLTAGVFQNFLQPPSSVSGSVQTPYFKMYNNPSNTYDPSNTYYRAYKNMIPFKGCFIDAEADRIAYEHHQTGSPTESFIYGLYQYQSSLVYHTGYFYYGVSCNGVNSFADPSNIQLTNALNIPIPTIIVSPSLVTYDDNTCFAFRGYK